MLEGRGEVHLGRTAYIIHHILAKKEYSDLILKLKQSGKHVSSGGLISVACPGCMGWERRHCPHPSQQGPQGKEELPTQFLWVKDILGRKVLHLFVYQHSNLSSVREKGGLTHSVWEFYGALP